MIEWMGDALQTAGEFHSLKHVTTLKHATRVFNAHISGPGAERTSRRRVTQQRGWR